MSDSKIKMVVVIPTYNEKETVTHIIDKVHECCPETDILIVDDSSPDGTGNIVKSLQKDYLFLNLLLRSEKTGLGAAYIDAFRLCIEKGYDVIIQMDADMSHPPEALVKMISRIRDGADLVIGSRYISGGAVKDWNLFRWITSRFGSFYAALILRIPVKDVTGGFKAWRAKLLKKIINQPLILKDFGFQIEMTYRALKQNAVIEEEAIIFQNRTKGDSKMSSRIVLNALLGVWKIKLG